MMLVSLQSNYSVRMETIRKGSGASHSIISADVYLFDRCFSNCWHNINSVSGEELVGGSFIWSESAAWLGVGSVAMTWHDYLQYDWWLYSTRSITTTLLLLQLLLQRLWFLFYVLPYHLLPFTLPNTATVKCWLYKSPSICRGRLGLQCEFKLAETHLESLLAVSVQNDATLVNVVFAENG